MLNLSSKHLIFTILLFFSVFSLSYSQSFSKDLLLINNEKPNSTDTAKSPSKLNFFQKINPLRILYNGSLRFYQKNISVQIAANCVFEKSCSRFSKDLTQEFGILGGIVLSIDRLSRCNRISLTETSPLNFSKEGKIKESTNDYRF